MPDRRLHEVAPRTRIHRLTEITSADVLEPGGYVICRGDEGLYIELSEPMSVAELASIMERLTSVRMIRVA